MNYLMTALILSFCGLTATLASTAELSVEITRNTVNGQIETLKVTCQKENSQCEASPAHVKVPRKEVESRVEAFMTGVRELGNPAKPARVGIKVRVQGPSGVVSAELAPFIQTIEDRKWRLQLQILEASLLGLILAGQ